MEHKWICPTAVHWNVEATQEVERGVQGDAPTIGRGHIGRDALYRVARTEALTLGLLGAADSYRSQPRVEIKVIRPADLKQAEGGMQGIHQDIARPGQHHAGDDQG
ncbi:MAG: hypothetical protein WAM21_03310, partial [Steroidobacteraceae bacterium]